MSIFSTSIGSLVIPLGDDKSQSFAYSKACDDADGISIFSPASLSSTYKFQVSQDATTWFDLHLIDDTVVKVPTAGCAIIYNGIFGGIFYLRIKAAGAVGADETFLMRKITRGFSG